MKLHGIHLFSLGRMFREGHHYAALAPVDTLVRGGRVLVGTWVPEKRSEKKEEKNQLRKPKRN